MIGAFARAAVAAGLIEAEDRDYLCNQALEIMGMDAPDEDGGEGEKLSLPRAADALCEMAVKSGVCGESAEEIDRFRVKLLGLCTPSPARTREEFARIYECEGPARATEWFYRLCRACDYIRTERVAQNIIYDADTACGRLTVTINLSKPEKDPRDIIKARAAAASGYPKCMLCAENPGYAGRPGFPARQNHRAIPLSLSGEKWYFQYSPYLYYNEHCIVLCAEHRPMKTTRETFARMFDFLDLFPHYFIGSNADLPIVGGSILSHDHYQSGNYVFPMDAAKERFALDCGDAEVSACAADWPMTCLRFESKNKEKLIAIAMRVLDAWRGYSDETRGILARTTEPHNAVTPILRKKGDGYILSLVLRNNRTTDAHPLGIFHPHQELHHIKKENIGLIEVMGLFILPGRLKKELSDWSLYLQGKAEKPLNSPHEEWIASFAPGRKLSEDEAEKLIKQNVAEVCRRVLEDAGVFKQTEDGERGLRLFCAAAGLL